MDTDIAGLEAQLQAAGSRPEAAPARVDALNELAWALRFKDTERANRLSMEAREVSRAMGYTLGQARAARVLGMTTRSSETLRDVLAFGEEAKVLFDQAGDKVGAAASRDFLASIFEYTGDLSTGMELALEALSIAREIDDPVRQAFALCNVGGILAATGDASGARNRLLEGLSLFEGVAHSQGIGRVCSLLSSVCRESGDTEGALRYARRGLEVAEPSSDSDDYAIALASLGELEQVAGNRDQAERLFRESLSSYRNDQARAVLGLPVRVSLARLLAQRGALADAEAELTRGLATISALGASSPAEEANVRQALADVAEEQGELAAAVEQLRAVVQLRERAARNDTRSQLAQLQARAELKAAQQEAEIHRLKFVELSQMQSKLVQAEKMAQLGMLAAGTAHELNSPLGVLRSNLSSYATATRRLLELVGSEGAASPRVEKLSRALSACKRTSEDAIERLSGVVENFKGFTQLDQPERRVFNVVDGLRSAVALLRPNVRAEIGLESRFEPVPDIEGWPGQLNQAFMTVLLNATQAIDGQGVVTVETARGPKTVVVRIHDSGRGMSEAERERLFDVGWASNGERTKMRLGLSAAYATVQRHEGSLAVESAPGQGSTFVFSFPAS